MSRIRIVTLTVALVVLLASAGLAAKPGFDFNWYGYVKLDASYDQSLTSHGNFAMWVQPQVDGEEDEQFNMTHKQTRFGVVAKGSGYGDLNLAGKLEFDFYGGGGPENKALLLLRHAYFTLQSGRFELLAGQSWDLISPLNPSTLNYPVMWGCGNFGYRRPQVRLSYDLVQTDATNLRAAGGFFRTIGNDLTPTLSLATEVADGEDDGTDAGIPSVQGLVDVEHTFGAGHKVRFGASGLFGQMKAEGTLGTDETYESWAFVGHCLLALKSGVGVSGEFFSGSNLGSYLGGIANSSTIEGVETKGGWASLWFKPHSKVKLTVGGGMDDPDDAGLATGNRSRNQSIFGNVQISPLSEFMVGVEVSNWQTDYIDGDTAETLRLQTSLMLKF